MFDLINTNALPSSIGPNEKNGHIKYLIAGDFNNAIRISTPVNTPRDLSLIGEVTHGLIETVLSRSPSHPRH